MLFQPKIDQTGGEEPARDFLCRKSEPADTEFFAHPFVLMGHEVHGDNGASWLHHPRHLGDRV